MKRPASTGRSSTTKISLVVGGHRTSISLEPEFIAEFRRLCREAEETVGAAATRIDRSRPPQQSLSSAIRVEVLRRLRAR